MKFSESWLRELIDPPVTVDELAEQLTMAGLEIESIEAGRQGFSGVVVGKVDKVDAHPKSNKLKVCVVDVGDKASLTVVCGADNVLAGRYYPLARPGANLPGGLQIKSVEIQGVMSEGMLCSEKELGLTDNSSGIYDLGNGLEPGADLGKYLHLNDNLIEVSLTPNRGDCLSLTGIAREVAMLNNLNFSRKKSKPVATAITDKRNIRVSEAEACPRYCGRIILDIDTRVPTPVWIKERLRRSDVRSISVVVDLTNYVMLESGQPMHVFDNDKLRGDIDVRYAKANEKLQLLDGEWYELTDGTLVICDATGAIAMAGIMGGLPTSVTPATRAVFIESAFFGPQAVMGRARQYGLHTDASHRYERGVDPQLSHDAMENLSELLIEICGGKAGPVTEIVATIGLPADKSILLRSTRIKRLLGQVISSQQASDILVKSGCKLTAVDGGWQVRVPSYRFDLGIEADLIEEIARIYGYGRIADTVPGYKMHIGQSDQRSLLRQEIMATLVQRGYREILSYSFVDPQLQTLLTGDTDAVQLLNPISPDMAVMRQSLWPGLVQTLMYNINRQQHRVRLFEIGQVFSRQQDYLEKPLIGGIIFGNSYPEQWGMEDKSSDFYDLKSDVEAVLGISLELHSLNYQAVTHPALHSGQSAEIIYNNQRIGLIGALHPTPMNKLDLHGPVFLFELEFARIPSKKQLNFMKFSKYPSIRRDISIIIDEKIPVANVLNYVKLASIRLSFNLELFDVYRGEGIDLGKKSLALGLTFQRSSSTLTVEEADIAVGNILHSLHEQFGAKLRE